MSGTKLTGTIGHVNKRLTIKLDKPFKLADDCISYYGVKSNGMYGDTARANKLGKLEDLMEKYEIESFEALEEIIKDYDNMCKDFVEMATGIKVNLKS